MYTHEYTTYLFRNAVNTRTYGSDNTGMLAEGNVKPSKSENIVQRASRQCTQSKQARPAYASGTSGGSRAAGAVRSRAASPPRRPQSSRSRRRRHPVKARPAATATVASERGPYRYEYEYEVK